jgi:DNA topoisomerase-2
MVRKEYGLVPALIKIFDEILVNASDNRLRHAESCTRIDVVIDPGNAEEERPPYISVLNDGKGIPVQVSILCPFRRCKISVFQFKSHGNLRHFQMHRKEHLYVPEMLFGHLLTGSNFDDNERRVTGESPLRF